MNDERLMIKAKRDYHVVVAEAWRVYDRDVEDARKVRDESLEKIGDPRDPDTWRVYNESTLDTRIVFEEAIKKKRLDKNIKVAIVEAKKAKLKEA